MVVNSEHLLWSQLLVRLTSKGNVSGFFRVGRILVLEGKGKRGREFLYSVEHRKVGGGETEAITCHNKCLYWIQGFWWPGATHLIPRCICVQCFVRLPWGSRLRDKVIFCTKHFLTGSWVLHSLHNTTGFHSGSQWPLTFPSATLESFLKSFLKSDETRPDTTCKLVLFRGRGWTRCPS